MGIPTLIDTLTASGSASLADTSSMTSTYDEYMFVLTDIHPASDGAYFGFQVNASGESGYNESITSTFFTAYHNEAGSSTSLGYQTGADQANGTSLQYISTDCDNDADSSLAGVLHIFNPSNTTYVTHFYSRTQYVYNAATSYNAHAAGYINTTGAITQIEFKFASGNIDAGVIQIYGIS